MLTLSLLNSNRPLLVVALIHKPCLPTTQISAPNKNPDVKVKGELSTERLNIDVVGAENLTLHVFYSNPLQRKFSVFSSQLREYLSFLPNAFWCIIPLSFLKGRTESKMADVAVNLVIDHLVPFLIEEANLLKGVHKDVEFIKDEMESIRILLRDADGRAEIEDDVKVWVKQLRQVAFRMEDVLDEFRLRIAQQPYRSGVLGWVRKTFGSVRNLKPHHVVATEIQDIKTKLVEISQRKERYNFRRSDSVVEQQTSSSSGCAWNYRRHDALFAEEHELVGVEKYRDELVSCLVQGDATRTRLAVVGTGGVGKTTIVRKAYQSDQVMNHFHCHAWITVSQSFKVEDILVRLIKEFYESRKEPIPQGIDSMLYIKLINKLRDYLQGKRYVVILDDVWSCELWDSLKYALLDNQCGSRIMITSRRDDVASSFVESKIHIFYLNPLPQEDALVLFYKKVFGSNFGGYILPELEEWSRKLVNKSGGLPLAIGVMGGLLSKKEKTVSEWKRFHDNLSSNLGEHPNLRDVMKIIALSYHDLPYYLKSCFLYCGVFPEDYTIISHRLIIMWIAEGFVKEKEGKTLEEVAENYLDQLVSRSLVQRIDFSVSKEARKCSVHDMMREFILSRFVEEHFCEVRDEKNGASLNGTGRRLSIQYNANVEENVMENVSSPSLVRSVLMFPFDKYPMSLMRPLLSSSTLLKVLNLAGAPFDDFPLEITNLVHLRFLNLSSTNIKVVPSTLSKLKNLQSLILAQSIITELPVAVLRLQKLRNLHVSRRDLPIMHDGLIVPDEIGCLTSLHSLLRVKVNKGPSLIKNLGKLTELRELAMEGLTKEHGIELCTSVAKMEKLQMLYVFSSLEEDTVLDLNFMSSPPSLLQEMILGGRLEKLPDWITLLRNLNRLILDFSRLQEDPMKVLQCLPNLVRIDLRNHAYDGEELHFPAESFQKLRALRLAELDRLMSVKIDKGAMPILERLDMFQCMQLKVVPPGITDLTGLKHLSFWDMSKDLTTRLAKDVGADYVKVMHIPKIRYS